jgi:hypothetical protein
MSRSRSRSATLRCCSSRWTPRSSSRGCMSDEMLLHATRGWKDERNDISVWRPLRAPARTDLPCSRTSPRSPTRGG